MSVREYNNVSHTDLEFTDIEIKPQYVEMFDLNGTMNLRVTRPLLAWLGQQDYYSDLLSTFNGVFLRILNTDRHALSETMQKHWA